AGAGVAAEITDRINSADERNERREAHHQRAQSVGVEKTAERRDGFCRNDAGTKAPRKQRTGGERQQVESLQRRARADEQANQPGGQRQKKDGDQQHRLSLSTG